jgi:hypothetical protein
MRKKNIEGYQVTSDSLAQAHLVSLGYIWRFQCSSCTELEMLGRQTNCFFGTGADNQREKNTGIFVSVLFAFLGFC